MPCYYPVLAYRQFKDLEGKWKIKFISDRTDYSIHSLRMKYGDDLMLLPCGKCLGCKFDKAKDWATRAVCEMQYHDVGCFLTLTYDNAHYPGKLVKEHLIKFIKALRNRCISFKYLGAGEYGETTKRAHYHLCLFGYRPDDLIFHSKSGYDFLYTSDTLSKVWSKGFVLVGDLTYRSAGYVARYTTKKITDDDCFLVCSNRPGIGYDYYLEHCKDMLKDGFVYGDFGDSYKAPIPRYFEKLLLRDFPEEYDKLVKSRMSRVLDMQDNDLIHHGLSNCEELKILQADVLAKKLERFTILPPCKSF